MTFHNITKGQEDFGVKKHFFAFKCLNIHDQRVPIGLQFGKFEIKAYECKVYVVNLCNS